MAAISGIAGTAEAQQAAQGARLRADCNDFEALLTAQLIRAMRPEKSEESSGLTLGGNNPLQDVMDWELARKISAQSPFGVADALVKSLDEKSGAVNAAAENNIKPTDSGCPPEKPGAALSTDRSAK